MKFSDMERNLYFIPRDAKLPSLQKEEKLSLSNYGQTNDSLKCTYLIEVFFISFDYYATLQPLLLSPAEIAKTR